MNIIKNNPHIPCCTNYNTDYKYQEKAKVHDLALTKWGFVQVDLVNIWLYCVFYHMLNQEVTGVSHQGERQCMNGCPSKK